MAFIYLSEKYLRKELRIQKGSTIEEDIRSTLIKDAGVDPTAAKKVAVQLVNAIKSYKPYKASGTQDNDKLNRPRGPQLPGNR